MQNAVKKTGTVLLTMVAVLILAVPAACSARSGDAYVEANENAATAEITAEPTATATATPTCTPEPDTVESNIEDALLNGTSYLFQISDDYVFSSNLTGLTTMLSNGRVSSKTTKDAQWVQDELKKFSCGYIIRIDNGVPSMQDSANYSCTLTILDNDTGIALDIFNVSYTNNNERQITGTIKGNTLEASQYYNFVSYSNYMQSGRGWTFSGDYSVGLVAVPEDQWAPRAVELSHSRNSDNSITLTWVDPNPEGTVDYYEIYREANCTTEYTLIDVVSDCTSWTDSSDKAKSSKYSVICYYVVAYSAAGLASEASNIEIF